MATSAWPSYNHNSLVAAQMADSILYGVRPDPGEPGRRQPQPGRICGNATLAGATLTGATLSGANLSGANLSGANLKGCNLTGAILQKTLLRALNLSRCNLFRAVGVELESCYCDTGTILPQRLLLRGLAHSRGSLADGFQEMSTVSAQTLGGIRYPKQYSNHPRV